MAQRRQRVGVLLAWRLHRCGRHARGIDVLKFNAAGKKASKDRKEVVAPKGRLGSGLLKRRSLGIATAVVLSVAPSGASAATHSIGSGAWSYFGDPRAVHAGGRTFVGWADRRATRTSSALDRNRLIEHQRLGPRLTIDDHNNPSLYVRTDGRIMVFYSAHNGPQMYYRVSAKPHSIARFSKARSDRHEHALGRWGYTYPNPLRADGRLWLLFRGANWQPSYTIRGARWSRAQTLVRGPLSRGRRGVLLGQGGRHRPYAKYDSDGERIHGDVHRGQPRGRTPTRSGTPGSTTPASTTRPAAAIARLGGAPPVGKLDRVRANSGYQQWALDIAVSPFGPIIVYMRRTLRPEYWWARYDGRRWRNYRITRYAHTPRSPGAVGGATLDHEDPSIVYLSRLTPGRPGHDVEVWRTPDGGRSWKRTTITRSQTDDLRPISPAGSRATARCSGFPGGGRTGRRSRRGSSPHRLAQQRAGDDQPLDLARALVDLGDLGVAVVALGGELLRIAVAAEDLDRLARLAARDGGGEELGLRALDGVGARRPPSAARRATRSARAASTSVCMSASFCWIACRRAIGPPNALRSLA